MAENTGTNGQIQTLITGNQGNSSTNGSQGTLATPQQQVTGNK